MKAGVYVNQKKDGTTLYRASITVKDKHISLGSYKTEALAHSAYIRAKQIMAAKKKLQAYLNEFQDGKKSALPFDKVVVLVNLRDNGVYIKTPIYLEKHSFTYYFSPEVHFIFDVDDLFYYSNHKIMKRGSHLFVADYGMQVSILSRYGIKPFAVAGRDYVFVNGDDHDFRYGNIEIINRYYGVAKETIKGRERYTAKIHVNGDIIIGRYSSEIYAAVAYNKAIKLLQQKGVEIQYRENFIDGLSELEYVSIYNKLRVSEKIINYGEKRG